MSKLIGVIVDGPGDYATLKARFKGIVKVVKTDGPRGHTVTIRQLVAGSRKQIAMLRDFGCRFVILMPDFEERRTEYSVFVSELKEEVRNLPFGTAVEVCVPNRMIENWYLADTEEISSKRNYIRKGLGQKPYEGTHGKKELKQLFANGTSYNEVLHGPELFSTIRFEVAIANSSSLDNFLTKLGVTR